MYVVQSTHAHAHTRMHTCMHKCTKCLYSFNLILSNQDHTLNYTKSPPASTARSQMWAVIQGPLSNTHAWSHTAYLGNLLGMAYGSPVGWWPPRHVRCSCQGKGTGRRWLSHTVGCQRTTRQTWWWSGCRGQPRVRSTWWETIGWKEYKMYVKHTW